jgi:hypothetical protein
VSDARQLQFFTKWIECLKSGQGCTVKQEGIARHVVRESKMGLS